VEAIGVALLPPKMLLLDAPVASALADTLLKLECPLPPKKELLYTGDFLLLFSPNTLLFATSSAVSLSFAMDLHRSSLFSTIVMKGLCAGLGEENGFALGDFGDGNTNGGGIVNEDREPDALPKLLTGAEPNGLLFALLARADANGFDFAYDENPPKQQERAWSIQIRR
jgi:hypothetical protein